MLLERFLPLLPLSLDWVQVGVSSHTTSPGGIYSMHAANRNIWQSRHMPIELFRRLVPSLHGTGMVHLQGWGEPFLNPDIFRMLDLAKARDCRVTTSTNAEPLTDEMLQQMVLMQLDVVTFTMSALTERDNQERKGTSLHAVFRAIDQLNELKARYLSDRPVINLLYTLLRSGLNLDPDPDPIERDELSRLAPMVQDMGVHSLIIAPLSFTTRPEHQAEALIPADEAEFQAVQSRLETARHEAGKLGMRMHYFLVYGGKEDCRCIENVRGAAFIDETGEVRPCVFTGVPVQGERIPYWFRGKQAALDKLSFGNIHDRALKEIWHGPAYRAFRRDFTSQSLPDLCTACWRPFMAAF